MVKVRVTYIGSLADALGLHTEVIEISSDNTVITVGELIKFLSLTRPSFKTFMSSIPLIHVFINDEEASVSDTLKEGDEVTLMPPLYEGG